ncbi:MAG: MarR family transcriptional regulator [Acidimicrobiales bacterium]|jgi:DNA-binding MarR family transcriptional regulator|nr:MarR family transcriptional regulator [Acidimicrobiales bacterium]
MARANEDELRAIDSFIEFIETVARSPFQRERVLDAAATKLSGAGLNALRIIARSGPIAGTEVARQLGVDQSTASRQIRPLEDAGLVARNADEADRRVAWLEATDEGRAVLERIHGQRRDDVELVLGDWSAEDRADLARLLERFKQSMLDAPSRRAEAS